MPQIQGLSTTEASDLLKEYGENRLPENPPPSDFAILLSQLKSPLVYVLIFAGIVTLFLKEYADTSIITLAVVVNTVLGFIQERKAGQALEALKKLVHPTARVIRDGEIKTIAIEQLVPGDVVVLKQGDKIPADGFLLESEHLLITESILTGESEPVSKEIEGEVFMGTIVSSGNGKMQVTFTGVNTEMGKIAKNVQVEQEETPLGKQLVKFSKQLSLLVLVLVIAVFVVGLLTKQPLTEIFTTSVALAVSAIPEGLLVGLTVVLAVGMQRILARKGLVRNLVSAETLGGVTTICVDKTGTLTEGKMQVVNVVGEEHDLVPQINLANDLDTSVVVAAWEWASSKISETDQKELKKFERIDSLPFDSKNKYSAFLYHISGDGNTLFVTGAPDVLLKYSDLHKRQKEELEERIKLLSKEGKRLLAFARKNISKETSVIENETIESGLEWVGLLAFTDPVRTDVKNALKEAKQAGISLMVITGDYAETAKAVLAQLDIDVKEENIITGEELLDLDEKELARRLLSGEGVKLFARTKPDQKLKIVETLKKHGEVVAMMGDGVNDAPALSKADIGIVVGEASDVAKESADLVLLDSSFSTIIAAVEEGRRIFDNLRKIILYLMVDAFEGILVVLSSLILNFPLPVTAIHVLWINLVSDGFPHLALTVDPASKGTMQRGPRSPNEPLISTWMARLIAIVSLSGFVFALSSFLFSLKTTQDLTLARSVAFATLGINSLVYVFSVRTLTEPFWKVNMFENKWLLAAVGVGLVFQIFPFMTPQTREFFKIESIGWYWGLALGSAALMFIVIEVSKWLFRHHLTRKI